MIQGLVLLVCGVGLALIPPRSIGWDIYGYGSAAVGLVIVIKGARKKYA